MESLKWDWHIVDPVLGKPQGAEIASRINTIHPEIVIHGNTTSLTKQVCQYIKSDIVQVFWMLDYRTPKMLKHEKLAYEWMKNGEFLNAIFISSRGHIDLWKKAFGTKCYFAPHACHIPSELEYSEDHSYDVLFIGCQDSREPFARRMRLIQEIDRLSPVPIKFINFNNEADRVLRNQVWFDMSKYYHSSKIVLDVSHFWNNWGYCSGRYWYTATYGGCAVTKQFPGCSQLFPDDCKWYFDTPEQAAYLIETLLDNEEKREQTKFRVARYAWRNHSYAIRFQQMLRCLEIGKQVPMY
jgi:hypothetical protein